MQAKPEQSSELNPKTSSNFANAVGREGPGGCSLVEMPDPGAAQLPNYAAQGLDAASIVIGTWPALVACTMRGEGHSGPDMLSTEAKEEIPGRGGRKNETRRDAVRDGGMRCAVLAMLPWGRPPISVLHGNSVCRRLLGCRRNEPNGGARRQSQLSRDRGIFELSSRRSGQVAWPDEMPEASVPSRIS